jgi:hypothetical protein
VAAFGLACFRRGAGEEFLVDFDGKRRSAAGAVFQAARRSRNGREGGRCRLAAHWGGGFDAAGAVDEVRTAR